MIVNVENKDFSLYDKFLSEYDEWIESRREIKLLFLLQPDKKIQFDIHMHYSDIYVYSKNGLKYQFSNVKKINQEEYYPLVSVKNFKFILKNNKIEELIIETSKEEKIKDKQVNLKVSNNGNPIFYINE